MLVLVTTEEIQSYTDPASVLTGNAFSHKPFNNSSIEGNTGFQNFIPPHSSSCQNHHVTGHESFILLIIKIFRSLESIFIHFTAQF